MDAAGKWAASNNDSTPIYEHAVEEVSVGGRADATRGRRSVAAVDARTTHALRSRAALNEDCRPLPPALPAQPGGQRPAGGSESRSPRSLAAAAGALALHLPLLPIHLTPLVHRLLPNRLPAGGKG